ncbi:phytochelatin synthase family protein [Desulfosarcina sp. OttesenSCG-928-G10]|nr:phytochelatin synthase family protein [Desulfosarcina sp. OttesenSCG-928-G10]MDL2321482.1 phytochelatin synthase family protein [Desulfosarcina sp. OttesenSCG-928-B08]
MNLAFALTRPAIYFLYGFRRLTGCGSFRKNHIQYTDFSIHPNWNPLKQALWKYHVKQFHLSSCSVASVVSCVNAITSLVRLDFSPETQHGILDHVRTGHWKERMRPEGHQGRRGLPLALLGDVVKDSMDTYHLPVRAVEVVPFFKKNTSPALQKTLLKKRLMAFDQDGKGLLIAHFDQGRLVPTLNIPHISPVGGYDAKTGRVTMLDVDPYQPRPYTVNLDTFVEGLSSDYHYIFRPLGYTGGGYVYIELGHRS